MRALLIALALCVSAFGGYDTLLSPGGKWTTANWSNGFPTVNDTVIHSLGFNDTLDTNVTVAGFKSTGTGTVWMAGKYLHVKNLFDHRTSVAARLPDSLVCDSAADVTLIPGNVLTITDSTILKFTQGNDTLYSFNNAGQDFFNWKAWRIGNNDTLTATPTSKAVDIGRFSGGFPRLVIGNNSRLVCDATVRLYTKQTDTSIQIGTGSTIGGSQEFIIANQGGADTTTTPGLTFNGSARMYIQNISNGAAPFTRSLHKLSGNITYSGGVNLNISGGGSNIFGSFSTEGYNIDASASASGIAFNNGVMARLLSSNLKVPYFQITANSQVRMGSAQCSVTTGYWYTEADTNVVGETSKIWLLNNTSQPFYALNNRYHDIEKSGSGKNTVIGNIRCNELRLTAGKYEFANGSTDSMHDYYRVQTLGSDTTYRNNTLFKISGKMHSTSPAGVVGDTSYINFVGAHNNHDIMWANQRSDRIRLMDSGTITMLSPWRVRYLNDSTAGDSIKLNGYDLYCDSLFRMRGHVALSDTFHVKGNMQAFSTATASATGTGLFLFDSTNATTLTNSGGNLGRATVSKSAGSVTASGNQRFDTLVLSDGIFDMPTDTLFCNVLIDTTSDSTTFHVIVADYILFGANAKPGFAGPDSAILGSGCAITVVNNSGHVIPDSAFPFCVPRNAGGSFSSQSATGSGDLLAFVTLSGSFSSQSATASGNITVTPLADRDISGAVFSQSATASGNIIVQSLVATITRRIKFNFGQSFGF